MAAGDLSVDQLSDAIDLHTGGISASPTVFCSHKDVQAHNELLSVGSMCLERNVPRMTDLLAKVMLEADFSDQSRLKSLVQGYALGAANGVPVSVHLHVAIDMHAYQPRRNRDSLRVSCLAHIWAVYSVVSVV